MFLWNVFICSLLTRYIIPHWHLYSLNAFKVLFNYLLSSKSVFSNRLIFSLWEPWFRECGCFTFASGRYSQQYCHPRSNFLKKLWNTISKSLNITPFKCTMIFSKFIQLSNHHQKPISEHFYHPQKDPLCPSAVPRPCLFPTYPQPAW